MIFLSNCGEYIAIRVYGLEAHCFDVIAINGSKMWLYPRYKPTGWDDEDHRYVYPEFPHMVGGFSNYGYENKVGRWVNDFELSFSDHDVTIKIDRFKGNTVIKEYKARFKKPIKKLAWKYKNKKGEIKR